jgi:glycosyltransferase involved in cell wall biosynthesis
MDVSIVIPLLNEEESLPELCAWIERVVTLQRLKYEVILIDDGSTDNSWKVIRELSEQNPNIKGIKFQRNYGKSAALNEGFKASLGDYIITMDADMQDSPDEIPELLKTLSIGQYDLVSGWKKVRYDNTFTKNIPSKLFNAAARKMSGIKLNDFNCGLKIYRSNVVKSIEVYGEMHRYVPVLAKWAGFRKIGEKVVEHRPRKYGVTKFGWDRFINGFLDLMTIFFVGKFGKRPMHFFGAVGTLFMFIGAISAFYLIGEKIYLISIEHVKPRDVTQMPAFYLALTSIIIGVQLFLAGFIGELVSRNSSYRNSYLIEKRIE